MTYDLKIAGVSIIDGSGSPAYAGDVGVKDGRVVAVGSAPDGARRTIRADGQAVTPGFVDIHTHYDAQVLWDPLLSVSPWHGVTSVVMGNCGFSIAPTRPEHRDLILRTLERVEGMDVEALRAGLGDDWGFTTYPEYLDAIERRGLGVNAASFLGHTALRLYVMGEASVERAATEAETGAMQAQLAAGLKAGAIGFSTSTAPSHFGFDGKPVPSRLAGHNELMALADTVGRAGEGVYLYMGPRAPEWNLFEEIAKRTGRTTIWGVLLSGQQPPGQHRPLLDRSAELQAKGLPIYPLTACRPIVFDFNLRFPVAFNSWSLFRPVKEAATDAAKETVYRDASFRAAFKSALDGPVDHDATFPGGRVEADSRRASFRMTEITLCPQEPTLEGRRLADIAAERGVHPGDLLLDLSLADRLQARFALPLSHFDEQEVGEILRHPSVVVGLSDAGAHVSQLCDACYSTHLLGHWVREKKLLPLEQAVHMLTARPAEIFGLSDRGRLAVGRPADLVVFDPDNIAAGPLERVRDQPAGAERLVSKPRGIEAVVVNGTVLPPAGEPLPKGQPLPGRLLRHGHA